MILKIKISEKEFNRAEKGARLESTHCVCDFQHYKNEECETKTFRTSTSGFIYHFVNKKNGQYYLQYEGALEAFGAQSLCPNLPVMTGKKVIVKSSRVLPLGEYLWEDLFASHRPLAQKYNQKIQRELEEKDKKKSKLVQELYDQKMALVEPIIYKYFPDLTEGENNYGYLGYAALEYSRTEKNWGIPSDERDIFQAIGNAIGIYASGKQWNSRIADLEEKTTVYIKDGKITDFNISHSVDMNWNQWMTTSVSSSEIKRSAEREVSALNPELLS